uniref:Uncharacterized protein n=1 Tax=Opuntia streptacantha TaxID=393608 RepID=A0A7C8YSE5_OPUST
MISPFRLLCKNSVWCRFLHFGEQLRNPVSEDIVFQAVCVNLRRKLWKLLEQLSSNLTDTVVSRVVREFRCPREPFEPFVVLDLPVLPFPQYKLHQFTYEGEIFGFRWKRGLQE